MARLCRICGTPITQTRNDDADAVQFYECLCVSCTGTVVGEVPEERITITGAGILMLVAADSRQSVDITRRTQ